MNRFQKKRGFSLSQLTLPASILIFLLIFLLFYKGVGSVSQTASEKQMENLQQAKHRPLLCGGGKLSGKSGLSQRTLRDHLRPGKIYCGLRNHRLQSDARCKSFCPEIERRLVMDLKNARKHSTDILFVLLLFLVFTSSALAVILLGAKVYQNTASRMESNYTVRTALAYVTEKIRHADESGAISPGELDGLPALILSQKIEGTSYRTYLYFQDGALKELLTEASREVTPEQGTAIVSLAGFSIEKTEDGFYSVRAEDANGEVLSAYIRPRTEVANSNA